MSFASTRVSSLCVLIVRLKSWIVLIYVQPCVYPTMTNYPPPGVIEFILNPGVNSVQCSKSCRDVYKVTYFMKIVSDECLREFLLK